MASDDDATSTVHTIQLPDDADAPALARHYLSEHATWLQPQLLDDALVLVSELVTNAISYGHPDITLRIRRAPPGIGVAVEDAGAEMPKLATGQPDPDQPSGRGLLIVDAIADHWGVTPTEPPPGKTVWFELATIDD